MNVLSTFDGKSCGMVALERAGKKVDMYFASEIDTYAMQVSKANYPDIIQMGDVCGIDETDFRLFMPRIDLLIGGSPCQGFSFAGKQLNFNDPRSKLFFEFLRLWEIVKRYNPNAKFMLENVLMKQEYQDVISNYLGVKPLYINSALVSAQNRQRLYWTNITDVALPQPSGVYLEDILETDEEVLDQYKVPDTPSRRRMWGDGENGKCRNLDGALKSSCVTTKMDRWSNAGLLPYKGFCRFLTPTECERLQGLPDGYTKGVPLTQRYKMLGNGWQIDTVAHIFKNIS